MAVEFISGKDHYEKVVERVSSVKKSLWIGTSDIKDLHVKSGKSSKPFLGVLKTFDDEVAVLVQSAGIVTNTASTGPELIFSHPKILPDGLAVIACKQFYPAYAMAFSF